MPFDSALNPYVDKVRTHEQIVGPKTIFEVPHDQYRRVLDLGCGNGHFLQDYTKLDSSVWAVGVEKRFKRAFKTAEKLNQSQAKVLQMDLFEFFDQCPSAFWDEVWFQFPDPWPKLKHEKNRPVNKSSFEQIYRILRPGSSFYFRSDCLNYAELLQDLNRRSKLFSSMTFMHGDLFTSHPKTLFQRKFELKRIPLFSVKLTKAN